MTTKQQKIFSSVYVAIMKMEIGEIKELSKTHANYDNFIYCVKHIINNKHDSRNGFSLTFNSEYTKLRKDFLN